MPSSSDRPSQSSHLPAGVSRRSMLKGSFGALALAGAPALLAACSSSSGGGGGGGTGSSGGGATSIGSNYSDAAVRSAFKQVVDAYPGGQVSINTVDHNSFQNNIQNYLQGNPDDTLCWFAGNRMKFFAAQGLLTPIDDVWKKIGDHFTDAVKAASKGDDGHYYLVPWVNYPWVMFYKESLFKKHGYKVPGTWDDLMALCQQMQKDGFANPVSIGQKDGWPAMGTFDIINMRMNGYQFHIDLMAHKEKWTDQRVLDTFAQWQKLTPYYTPGATGRTWQDAVKLFDTDKSPLIFQGTDQVGPQVSKESLKDLKFFPFPEIKPAYPTDSAIDAPIDGFLMSAKVENQDAAASFLEYLGTAQAEQTFLKPNPSDIGTATDYDQSTYTPLQKDSVEIIKNTKSIAQFLDRDTRPDFAYPIVQNAMNDFLNNPSSYKSICNSLEAQAQTIFTS